DAELTDVLRCRAILAFGLDIHLPHASEEVEVIHEGTTHKRLERPIDATKIHTLLHHLVMIDISKYLRNAADKGRHQGRELGTGAGHFKELAGVLRQEFDTPARTIFQHERNTTGGTDTRNRWWREGKRLRFHQASKPLIKAAHDDVSRKS